MMSALQYPQLAEDDDDESRVATPTAATQQGSLPSTHPSTSPPTPAPADDNDDIRAFSASLASMLDTTLNLTDGGAAPATETQPPPAAPAANGHIVLPLPTASSSRVQSAHILPDTPGEETIISLDDLPPEVAAADISIAREPSLNSTASRTHVPRSRLYICGDIVRSGSA